MAMRVRVGCEFVHTLASPAHAVLQVEPRPDGDFSLLGETWHADPAAPWTRYVDSFGNVCRRTDLPAGQSTLRFDALIELEGGPDPVVLDAREHLAAELPPETLLFTLPSRFCPSDQLAATAWDLFGGVAPGWSRVQAICDWVHGELTFGYGSSTPTTTAADVFDARKGVCRDFAHLGVTFCRALSIPARYAFGYLPDIDVPEPHDPMDFCAWMEVFLGGQWWTFDPRNNTPRRGRVLIGRGRDALDVAMVTTFGAAPLDSMLVWADQVMA
ncbi:MAG TPA: transglutaminase family protein [Acidimicrobiales bacterium]|nr:transglutaminase family protein [Acidimicrobiales bacterium]